MVSDKHCNFLINTGKCDRGRARGVGRGGAGPGAPSPAGIKLEWEIVRLGRPGACGAGSMTTTACGGDVATELGKRSSRVLRRQRPTCGGPHGWLVRGARGVARIGRGLCCRGSRRGDTVSPGSSMDRGSWPKRLAELRPDCRVQRAARPHTARTGGSRACSTSCASPTPIRACSRRPSPWTSPWPSACSRHDRDRGCPAGRTSRRLAALRSSRGPSLCRRRSSSNPPPRARASASPSCTDRRPATRSVLAGTTCDLGISEVLVERYIAGPRADLCGVLRRRGTGGDRDPPRVRGSTTTAPNTRTGCADHQSCRPPSRSP